jgi:hypothetical protein
MLDHGPSDGHKRTHVAGINVFVRCAEVRKCVHVVCMRARARVLVCVLVCVAVVLCVCVCVCVCVNKVDVRVHLTHTVGSHW